jgi:hypothetical protein
MATYSSRLRLTLPATGEYTNTWGTVVNDGITSLVDDSISGTSAITIAGTDYTLTSVNGSTDEARRMFIVATGSPGAARNVICPAVTKLYSITNSTTGGFALTLKTSAGTGISVPNGATMLLKCDGTNVVSAASTFTDVTYTGTLTNSAGTANGVTYLNGSKVVTTGSALTFDGTNFATTGTASATKLIPTGGSATGNGMYLPAANVLAWSNNGAETMRLDASGNLGIKQVPGTWAAACSAIEFAYPTLGQDADGSAFLSFNARNSTGSTWLYKTTDEASRFEANTDGSFRFYTAPSGTAGNAITFTQAMTLDASGNLLVGTTTLAGVGGLSLQVAASGSAIVNNNNAAATGYVFQSFRRSSTEIGSITQSGTTAVLYNLTSDQRLKENIQDAAPASALIDAIQVRQFDWKSDGSHQRYGFVAQELVTVAPEAVHAPADPEAMMAVDYSKLVPMLIKEVQALRARVAALEAA